MKTSVYSWRLSNALKTDLEREARLRNLTVSSLLELAVREWLDRGAQRPDEDLLQDRLHAAAAECIGSIAGGNPRRAEQAASTVRNRLKRRRRAR